MPPAKSSAASSTTTTPAVRALCPGPSSAASPEEVQRRSLPFRWERDFSCRIPKQPRRQSQERSAGGEKVRLADTSRFQFTPDLTICRLLNGMWQVSGAHGYIEPSGAIAEMFAYHDAGFTTWDLADHYGPAEDFVGDFRRQFAARYGVERLSEIQAFTKWVPAPGRMTRRTVDN